LLLPPAKATFSAAVGSDGSDIRALAAVLFPSQDPHSHPHSPAHPHPWAPFWLFTKPIAVELFIMSDDDEMTTTLASGEERILENISHLHSAHTDTRHAHKHRYTHTYTQTESRER